MRRIRPRLSARAFVYETDGQSFSCGNCGHAIAFKAYGTAYLIDEVEYPVPGDNVVCPGCKEEIGDVPVTYATLKEARDRAISEMEKYEESEDDSIAVAETIEIDVGSRN